MSTRPRWYASGSLGFALGWHSAEETDLRVVGFVTQLRGGYRILPALGIGLESGILRGFRSASEMYTLIDLAVSYFPSPRRNYYITGAVGSGMIVRQHDGETDVNPRGLNIKAALGNEWLNTGSFALGSELLVAVSIFASEVTTTAGLALWIGSP